MAFPSEIAEDGSFVLQGGNNILNMGCLEQIFNHAMHILYTEGPRISSGPGFNVEWEETGLNFRALTRISVAFMGGHPVCVGLCKSERGDSPCALHPP